MHGFFEGEGTLGKGSLAHTDPNLSKAFSACNMTHGIPLFPRHLAAELQNMLKVSFSLDVSRQGYDALRQSFDSHTSLIHVPPDALLDVLRAYRRSKTRDGAHTSAVFLTPLVEGYTDLAPWQAYLRRMRKVRTYTAEDWPGCPYPMQAWYDPPCYPPPPPKACAAVALTTCQPPSTQMAASCMLAAMNNGSPSMLFEARIAGAKGLALMDTGASTVFISEEFCLANGIKIFPFEGSVTLAGNQSTKVIGKCSFGLSIGRCMSHAVEAIAMPELVNGVALILGESWLRKHGVTLDYSTMQCTVLTRRGRLSIMQAWQGSDDGTPSDAMAMAAAARHEQEPEPQAVPPPLTAKQARRAMKRGARPFLCCIKQVFEDEREAVRTDIEINPVVAAVRANPGGTNGNNGTDHPDGPLAAEAAPTPQKESVEARIEKALFPKAPDPTLLGSDRLRNLLLRFKERFPDSLPPFAAQDHGVKHCIDLIPGSKVPYRKPYRMSPKELGEAKRQVQEFLDKGIIVPSQSPFGANMFFVAKSDGSLRAVVDFRFLNAICVKQRFPMPNAQDLIDRMQGKTIWSTMDLSSGFYQIALNPEDRHKTAFSTPFGHYEFTCLPMGLCNSPSTFQSVMTRMFAPYDFVLVYVDDLIICSATPEEHEQHLAKVLSVLEEHKMYVSLKKCQFNRPEVKFLGHICGRDGVKVDPAKVKAVAEWPTPKTPSHVSQFLGLANYMRRFIQGYAAMAAPLYELTKKDAAFEWRQEHDAAFGALKEALTTAPVLAMPDYGKTFEVRSDASLLGTGAVLMQDDRPVAYHSKRFTSAERNYGTGEQELLGVIHALDAWRCYLEGSKVKLVTDHHPLIYLNTQPLLSRRQARWLEKLSRFDYEWEYRPGRVNVADPLSRSPQLALALLCCAGVLRSGRVLSNGNGTAAAPRPAKRQRMQAAAPSEAKSKAKAGARKKREADDQVIGTPPMAPLLERIRQGYETDSYFHTSKLTACMVQKDGLWLKDGLIAVPDAGDLRELIIKDMHEPPLSGHVGPEKTLQAVSRIFWWPRIRRDCIQFVQRCHACQCNKSSSVRPGGLLQPLPIPERRWECVTMDLITSLPKTANGNDAIVVFVDKLSKMCHFVATTTSISAEQFAEVYVNAVVRHHGLSRTIVSDRDPRFQGKFWQSVCDLLGMKSAMSTAFHPATDGQTERANRTLEDMLRHYVGPHQDDWDRRLAAAEFAVNNSWQASVRNTPFFLNYGQHPLTPVTIGTEHVVPSATAFVHGLEEHIKAAKLCLRQAQDRQKAYADKSRRDVSFAAGDMVLLNTRNIKLKMTKDMTKKLMPKWVGPYKVTERIGPVAVRLELPPHLKLHNVFHVSLVKPYLSDGPVQPPPPLEIDADGPIYTAQELMDKRERRSGTRRITEYLVRWQGYGPQYDSWEPSRNILDKGLIEAFKARLAAR